MSLPFLPEPEGVVVTPGAARRGLVRAFAEAQGGVRASNTVAERLVRVEPVVQGELAFLGLEWPEMQAFLGAHGMTSVA
jgi:hypothetical protein